MSKKRVKCYAHNRQLKKKNDILTKKIRSVHKKLERLRKRREKENFDHTSPEALVNKFLKENKCFVNPEIKKKLVSY